MDQNKSNLSDELDDQSVMQQPTPAQRDNGTREVSEGKPMGGHNFNEDGNTPMGDDKDNPSRNAGYNNGYFARTAPSEEDTANNNFKAAHQEGEADYDAAQGSSPGPQEVPEQQKVGGEESDSDPDTDSADIEPGLGEPQPDHGAGGTETGADIDHIET